MARRLRMMVWGFVALTALLLGWLVLRQQQAARLPPVPTSNTDALAGLGAPFTLTGGDGRRFASSSLAGRPYAIFFGFTHCPDVCPTMLARLAKLRRALGKGDSAFAILFVTVDPARDTPAVVGRYSGLFGSPVIGLTGTPAEIDAVRRQWGIFAERAATGGSDYTIDHTATVFVVGADGKVRSTIAPDESDPPALAKLRRVVG